MLDFIFRWQTLIGAIIGASTPFVLWWFTEMCRRYREYKDGIELLEKLIVDQMNLLIDAKRTIGIFVDEKISKLIQALESDKSDAYNVGLVFFPLFSIRQLDSSIHNINTKSGYVYSKIAKIFSISADFPLIMDDLRRQFEYTLQNNRELSLLKVNSPEIQKTAFIGDLKRYAQVVNYEMLKVNIPVYLKVLAEAKIALSTLRKIGYIRWQLRFNPKCRFYFKKENYKKHLESVSDKIDQYFRGDVRKLLEEIDK